VNDVQTSTVDINRGQFVALLTGVVGLALCAFGWYSDATQFYQSYLLGFMLWLGIALGSFVLLSLHHLVGGGWGFVIQRLLEAGARTILLLALLFVPLFFGMQELYLWARPEAVAMDELLQYKSAYLNVQFFWIRAVAYFLLWSGFIFLLTKWSYAQDSSGDPELSRKAQRLGGPGILLYVITLTFASIDWIMSLDPHWFSTMFGFIFVIGQVLLTMAFVIVVLSRVIGLEPLSRLVREKHIHDLGNLLLAFVALWAYISLSQFLIIWSGNLPEEIPWYMHRMHGGWDVVAVGIVLFHFTVPFALLLSRRNKQRLNVLAKIAVAIIVMRFVDLYWIIVPNFSPEHFSVHWLDIAAPIGIGGVWMAAFLHGLKKRSLLPMNDPRLKEALLHESH